jgi:hypothetical protein
MMPPRFPGNGMLDTAQKGILAASLVPYLALSAYDGWLHEKARRVPRFEQVLHGLLAISATALVFGLFTARPWLAWPGLAVFVPAALADELGWHGALEHRERRLHHVAYASFAGFVAVAYALGAFAP